MALSISTHWNAFYHKSGESMIQEVLDLGVDQVELGYDLTIDLAAGVKKMISEGAVTVTSLHNYCPVPMAAPYGHPELFTLSSPSNRERNSAVSYTRGTIDFAVETKAKAIVVHAGRISTRKKTRDLIDLAENGRQYDEKYEKIKLKIMLQRDKMVQKHLDQLYKSIEELLPYLEKSGVVMALENLPSWETVPCESEMETLLKHFNSPYIRYWHDIGHGQIRQNLGFIGLKRWLEKLAPYMCGMHIHDVEPPARDHLMPPEGKIDFTTLKEFITPDTILVLEPAPRTPPEKVLEGARCIRTAFGLKG